MSTGFTPSDYMPGYEMARGIDRELATSYVDHTMVADPLADAAVEALSALDRPEATLFIRSLIDREDEHLMGDAPSALLALIDDLESRPEWLDTSSFTPGIRMFHRNAKLVLGAFVGGVLVEGFSTNISKSFFITGRIRDQGVRRLKQNNRHMIELFMPGGLDRGGDGWKLSVRVRLIHAQIRRLLNESDDWDTESWGVPLSSAHLGFAISAFSARLLVHMKSLGARFDDEERESFMAVWRYCGHLMGIPPSILFRDEEEALRLFRIGRICEPVPDKYAAVMANALVNSAPLVVGIGEPKARRSLAKYVYGVSRALIGSDLADSLEYPPGLTFGVLAWFRFQARYERVLDSAIPEGLRSRNFANYTSLLEASMFDAAGISYRMPDHVYAEESSSW